jgi:hypothetical protein
MRWMVIYEYEVPYSEVILNCQTMVIMGAFPFKEKYPWKIRESNPGPLNQ